MSRQTLLLMQMRVRKRIPISAVERLCKRRSVSGDGKESQPSARVQSISACEVQTFEKLQVIVK